MEYRFLGRSGLQVSELSFGTMTFGGVDFFKNIGNTQVQEARKLIDICLEAGVNLFDTADMYSFGQSEKILGEAIGKERRDKVLIATKAFMRMGPGVHETGLSRHHLIRACEDSLKRLGTDYIDLYQVHNFDMHTPLEETLSTLDQLIRDGKVRYVGCSNNSAWHAMKATAISERDGYQPYISQQIYYSLYERDIENELIPFALDQRLGTIVWSPLSFGLLSGKYKRDKPRPVEGRSSDLEGVLGSIDWERVYRIVDVLEEIAGARSKSVAQVALNWLLRRQTISSVIIGARNEEQLRSNLGAVGWSLTEPEVRKLEEVSAVPESYPTWHQHRFGGERNPPIAKMYRP